MDVRVLTPDAEADDLVDEQDGLAVQVLRVQQLCVLLHTDPHLHHLQAPYSRSADGSQVPTRHMRRRRVVSIGFADGSVCSCSIGCLPLGEDRKPGEGGDGVTALMAASHSGHDETVRALVDLEKAAGM